MNIFPNKKYEKHFRNKKRNKISKYVVVVFMLEQKSENMFETKNKTKTGKYFQNKNWKIFAETKLFLFLFFKPSSTIFFGEVSRKKCFEHSTPSCPKLLFLMFRYFRRTHYTNMMKTRVQSCKVYYFHTSISNCISLTYLINLSCKVIICATMFSKRISSDHW